jgi:CRP-like cAMP-binding protein
MDTYPPFAKNLLLLWAEKVRNTNQQREALFSLPLKERTRATLKALAPHFSNNEIPLTQEELSTIIGASRARVTEVLHELEKEKVISFSTRNIRFL